MPEVSVVLPTYNERDNIGPLIEAILANLDQSTQIIVVDDPGRRLEIHLADQRERVLGTFMRLQVTDVELIFFNYSEADRITFMKFFEINFFKGGG